MHTLRKETSKERGKEGRGGGEEGSGQDGRIEVIFLFLKLFFTSLKIIMPNVQ